jgi:hypothetical protein
MRPTPLGNLNMLLQQTKNTNNKPITITNLTLALSPYDEETYIYCVHAYLSHAF